MIITKHNKKDQPTGNKSALTVYMHDNINKETYKDTVAPCTLGVFVDRIIEKQIAFLDCTVLGVYKKDNSLVQYPEEGYKLEDGDKVIINWSISGPDEPHKAPSSYIEELADRQVALCKEVQETLKRSTPATVKEYCELVLGKYLQGVSEDFKIVLSKKGEKVSFDTDGI